MNPTDALPRGEFDLYRENEGERHDDNRRHFEKLDAAMEAIARTDEKLLYMVQDTMKKQEKQDKRICDLESKPTKRLDLIVTVAMTATIGGVIGYALRLAGL